MLSAHSRTMTELCGHRDVVEQQAGQLQQLSSQVRLTQGSTRVAAQQRRAWSSLPRQKTA